MSSKTIKRIIPVNITKDNLEVSFCVDNQSDYESAEYAEFFKDKKKKIKGKTLSTFKASDKK